MPNENDLSEIRTNRSEDRTILSNERTFASWMRTGMACVGVALGLKAVFREFEPGWVPRAVSEIFIIVAIMIFWAARNSAEKAHKRLREHETESQGSQRMTLIAAVLAFGAANTGVILWFL
ncbi:MAG: DUF202 domain-containing protein [Silicimonas sp.]|jgi:putative membrane protein|nr:DUF202 domain-containing protein [Silicimonas sp.]